MAESALSAPPRRLTLRTREAVLIGLVGVFAFGGSLSYEVRTTADARLAESLAQDLEILAILPSLEDQVRRCDHQTMNYLLTGDRVWLEDRFDSLARLRQGMRELRRAVLPVGADAVSLRRLDGAVNEALGEQRELIARRAAGRMSRAQALEAAAERHLVDQAVGQIAALRDLNYDGIRLRLNEGERASERSLWITLATSAGAAALLMLVLTVYVIRPIRELDRWARGWTAGQPMGPVPEDAGAEVEGLYRSVAEMSRRVSAQVRHEVEMARVKSQLVSVLGHEFNNALSVVHGVTTLLEETEGVEPPEERARYYQMIKANLRSIATEMQALIEMGRLESGQFAVQPRRMEVRGVLRESIERLRVLSDRRRQSVSLELPDVPLPVRGDPEALSLVATNLVSNAIKYSPEGGRVRVAVEPTAEGVRVSVADDGIGIAREDQERVFSGYFRTASGQAQAKGFGVGLALASRIVSAHGSRLRLESEPGKGSRFWFELPAWREEAPHGQG